LVLDFDASSVMHLFRFVLDVLIFLGCSLFGFQGSMPQKLWHKKHHPHSKCFAFLIVCCARLPAVHTQDRFAIFRSRLSPCISSHK